MNRRELLILGAGAVAWPFVAYAQKPMPVIGFLGAGSAPSSSPDPFLAAFQQGLNETGYAEGKNLAMEYRWAEGRYDRLPVLAAGMVAHKVDAIVTPGTAPARAAKGATSTIPIIFMGVGDPVGAGLVASLAHPAGNLTGFSNIAPELNRKRLELLSELVPQAKVIAVLVNPKNEQLYSERIMREVQEAARAKGVQIPILKAGTESEIDAAFATLVELHADALFLGGDPFFFSRREQFLALASRHAVPASYTWREFVVAGGLISYGVRVTDSFRQAGSYAGRILKGAKPADLPIQQPSKFDLVVNLKTAKTLGLTVPPSILVRADEVIE